jgi:hypothetical protein
MKATGVDHVSSEAGAVTLALTTTDGPVTIRVPLTRAPALARAMLADGEIAIHVDEATAALAAVCLQRVCVYHENT